MSVRRRHCRDCMNASSCTKLWLCEVEMVQAVVPVQRLSVAVTCEALASDWTGPTRRALEVCYVLVLPKG